jgi:hypothetical protein
MKNYFSKTLEVLFAGVSYILLHEIGHYLFAMMFSLSPEFVFTQQEGVAGLFLLSVGVSYTQTSVVANTLVLLGATILPLLVAGLFYFIGERKNNNFLINIAEIYMIFIVLNLIPFNVESSDGFRVWELFNGKLF